LVGVDWCHERGTKEPNTDWFSDEEQAKNTFERLVQQYEDSNAPVLARVWLIQNKQVVDERFIAQTPPPNYQ
jgi:hypothetical protein